MAKVFYLHWNRDEAEARVAALKKAGHEVRYHWSTEEHVKLADFTPEAVVISLDRLPSHGRQVAEWFWEAKKRQSIPIVFAGGASNKCKLPAQSFRRRSFALAMKWRVCCPKYCADDAMTAAQPGPVQAQALFAILRSRIVSVVPCERI